MGDKNNVVEVTAGDLLVKSGHAILKAVYMTEPGDNQWEIVDGTDGTGVTIFTVDGQAAANGLVLMPYINHPMNTGIFIDHISGTLGRLLVVYE